MGFAYCLFKILAISLGVFLFCVVYNSWLCIHVVVRWFVFYVPFVYLGNVVDIVLQVTMFFSMNLFKVSSIFVRARCHVPVCYSAP